MKTSRTARGTAEARLGRAVARLAGFVAGVVGALLLLPSGAAAHGVVLDHRPVEGVEVRAAFDTGEVMDEAQVSVFAPEDASEPWETGTTDERGRYLFVPDASRPGTWTVQVRQAGHGSIVNVTVEEDAGVTGADGFSGGGYGALQIGLMAAAGVWGFVGTALFFMRKK